MLVVVDTQHKIIHYLHNINRRNDYKDAAMLYKFVVGCFSNFLDAFEHSCAHEVLIYNLSIVKLPWTVMNLMTMVFTLRFLWSNLWVIKTLALFIHLRIG